MSVGPRGRARLAHVFRSEFNLFLASLRIGPVTEVEDRRAGAMAFIAAFAPEALDRPARDRLLAERARIREEPDFETHGWWRVAYLDAACFLLTRNARYVGLLARNLSHGSSSIRMGLIPAMGLVIPHVEPLELDIVEPVGRLMLNGAMYADAALCLLLAARMHPDKKRRIMREWLEAGPPGQVRALLERALSHGYVENSLMVEEYLGILSHLVTLSLEADPGSSEPRGPVQPLDFASRVRAHPLLSPLIAVGNS